MPQSPDGRLQSLDATFIVPVNNTQVYRHLEENLESRFTGYQLIPVRGANSFFDAWRQGFPQATRPHLVLTHQDTTFKSFPPLEGLFKDDVGMVGVAGSVEITKENPWWSDGGFTKFLSGKQSGGIYHGLSGRLGWYSKFGDLGNVVVLDGVCLVTPKDTLGEVGIPDQDWANWHFYDHVLALRYRDAEQKLQTVPIKMFHASTGDANSAEFKQIRDQFVAQYFSDVSKYEVARHSR